LKLVESWGLAAEVHFEAHKATPAVMRCVALQWPELKLTVDGVGPYSLFCMMSRPIRPGMETMLHFFEPRYRWMCKKLLEAGKPYIFGWVTGFQPSLVGSLCAVSNIYEGPDGTFDASFTCISQFSVVEYWEEMVPRMPRVPKLMVGYLKLMYPKVHHRQIALQQPQIEEVEVYVEDEEEEDEEEGSSGIDE